MTCKTAPRSAVTSISGGKFDDAALSRLSLVRSKRARLSGNLRIMANEAEPLLEEGLSSAAAPAKKGSRKFLVGVVAALALGSAAVVASRPAGSNAMIEKLFISLRGKKDCWDIPGECAEHDLVCQQSCKRGRFFWSTSWYHCCDPRC